MIRVTHNTLYVKDKEGKIQPIGMFGSGADETLREIRRVVTDEKAIIDNIRDEIDRDVSIVVEARQETEKNLEENKQLFNDTLDEMNSIADRVKDDKETTRQYVDIVQDKASFAFVKIDGYDENKLPKVSDPLESVVYMVRNDSEEDNNIYDKWIWYDGTWEKIVSDINADKVNILIDEKLVDLESKLEDFEGILNNKANAYAKKEIALRASSWVGDESPYTSVISLNGITSDSDVKILPSENFTLEQATQWGSAGIVTGNLGENSITLKAFGEKPTIDIPLTVLYTTYIVGSGVGPGGGSGTGSGGSSGGADINPETLEEIKSLIGGKANAYKKTSLTVMASSWNGSNAPYTNTLLLPEIDSDSDIQVLPSDSITIDEADAWSNARILSATQSDGSITLRAFGDKPSINIPVTIMYSNMADEGTYPNIEDELMQNFMKEWIENNKEFILNSLNLENGDNSSY